MSAPDELLDAEAVAGRLKIPPGTWRAWVSRKKAPLGIRLSARVRRWRSSTIDAFIAEREAASGDELAAARDELRERRAARKAGAK